MSLYSPCMCNVRTGYPNEIWFDVKSGVKQGSVISPLLFIAYMDKITKSFHQMVEIGEGDIMIYADDIFAWTEDRHELERIINGWKIVLENGGMKMNVNKTEILCISRDDEGNININVDGTSLNNVDKVKYLGSTFTNDGNNKLEIIERIASIVKVSLNCIPY